MLRKLFLKIVSNSDFSFYLSRHTLSFINFSNSSVILFTFHFPLWKIHRMELFIPHTSKSPSFQDSFYRSFFVAPPTTLVTLTTLHSFINRSFLPSFFLFLLFKYFIFIFFQRYIYFIYSFNRFFPFIHSIILIIYSFNSSHYLFI